MRNVARSPRPQTLEENAEKWTADLEKEIQRCEVSDEKISSAYFDKYNAPDVKNSLNETYGALCCYCESRVGVVEFGHIEHRMPKRKFPKSTYDWDNLHLSCTACNTFKGQKWDDAHPILDATADSIEEHLSYETLQRIPINRSNRGATTVTHTNINRDDLLTARNKILISILKIVSVINNDPSDPANHIRSTELKKKTLGEYGSFVDWAIKSFLRKQ